MDPDVEIAKSSELHKTIRHVTNMLVLLAAIVMVFVHYQASQMDPLWKFVLAIFAPSGVGYTIIKFMWRGMRQRDQRIRELEQVVAAQRGQIDILSAATRPLSFEQGMSDNTDERETK